MSTTEIHDTNLADAAHKLLAILCLIADKADLPVAAGNVDG